VSDRVITEFKGVYSALSNFSPHEVFYDGYWYPTAEHAFQAAKTFDDEKRWFIGLAASPQEAKRMGRRVELRDRWDELRTPIMLSILLWKFTGHFKTRQTLLATGTADLIEGNYWHDNYWGDCYCDKCSDISGVNQLGKSLMCVRSIIGQT